MASALATPSWHAGHGGGAVADDGGAQRHVHQGRVRQEVGVLVRGAAAARAGDVNVAPQKLLVESEGNVMEATARMQINWRTYGGAPYRLELRMKKCSKRAGSKYERMAVSLGAALDRNDEDARPTGCGAEPREIFLPFLLQNKPFSKDILTFRTPL